MNKFLQLPYANEAKILNQYGLSSRKRRPPSVSVYGSFDYSTLFVFALRGLWGIMMPRSRVVKKIDAASRFIIIQTR